MKPSRFFIFITIILLVYFLAELYIFHHLKQAFTINSKGYLFFVFGYWFLALCFPAGRFMERIWHNQLVNNLDQSKPIILLDHQPFHLNESASAGIYLQLLGHTHHGQLWQFQFLTKKIYQIPG